MMTATMKLDNLAQVLVDERLDAIDQVLLQAGVSRSERHGIVEEVAAQIQELLGRRGATEPSRADVGAVLESLDPPEAYAPEGARWREPDRERYGELRRRVPQPSLLALGSAFGGLFLLLLLVALLVLVINQGGARDELVLLVLIGLLLLVGAAVSVCGVLGIRQIRASEGWLTGLPIALFGALLFPLLILNGLVLTTLLVSGEIGVLVLAGVSILAANACLVTHAWRWVSLGYRTVSRLSRMD
jgi:hypothetical protein